MAAQQPPRTSRLCVTAAGLLLAFHAAPALTDTCDRWDKLFIDGVDNHAMAYDSDRGVVVLYGGGSSHETWEWDGQTWTLRAVAGPQAWTGHAMAYDSGRQVTVLFGGWDAMGTTAETWEWDGSEWTLRATSGPPARAGHALVYDSVRGATVLFGGCCETVEEEDVPYRDTWEWDGATWTQRADGPPRAWHAMAFDSARGVTVMHGGEDDWWERVSDTWEYDGTSWTWRDSGTTPAVEYHAMAFDSTRGVTVLHGGEDDVGYPLADTWEWDGASWSLAPASGPGERFMHAMAFDSSRGVTVLFGGGEDVRNDYTTWELDAGGWSEIVETRPPPANGHAMVYDSARGVSVMWGNIESQPWEWDGTDWTARDVPGPTPRIGHAMAYDSGRGVTVVYGGVSDETWEWDGTSWTQHAVSAPPARSDHAMAYDPVRGVTVMFGGSNGAAALGDTWEWDGTSWTEHVVSGPPARALHGMVYDEARGVIVLYGGRNLYGVRYTDVWEWDGTTWTARGVTGPEIEDFGLAYDSARDVTILFGGLEGGLWTNKMWEWDGSSWTRVYPSYMPDGVFNHAMAYDSARARIVMFGGIVGFGVVSGQTWEYNACLTTGACCLPDSGCSVLSPAECLAQGGDYRGDGVTCGEVDCTLSILAGPIARPGTYSTYYLLEASSWTAAQTFALGLGGNLATIDDADENEWVRVNLANYGGSARDVWIGFTDQAVEGTFVWISGAPVTFTNWSPGEPNNSGDGEHYAQLLPGSGQWNDNANEPVVSVHGVVEIDTSPLLGDLNCDGWVNNGDIDAFVLALSFPEQYPSEYPDCDIMNGDISGDGWVNNGDIDAFVALLNGK